VRLFLSRLVFLIGLSLTLAGGSAAVAAPDWRVTPDDMVLGNPKAKVTVIEYASASCPHCARFNNEVFPAFKAKYIDTGRVRYVMREFLTPPEEVAAAGFLTARCGGRAKYFTILDQVFRHQTEIYQNNDLQGVMERAGQSAGLTAAQVDACIYDGSTLGALNERVSTYIKRDEIAGTPTFIINGHPLGAAGEPSLASLDAAVAAARKGR
jgi:protein-disulfide isomerase